MPFFLRPEIIEDSAIRLMKSRASIGFINYLIFKRTQVLGGNEEVALSTKNKPFMEAMDDLAACYQGQAATIKRIDVKPFVNVFGSAEKGDKYISGKFTTNGPADTLGGRAWETVVGISGSNPRRAKLKANHARRLEPLMLKAGEALPNILDAAVWFFRGKDVSSLVSPATETAQNAKALTDAFKKETGLAEDEIRAILNGQDRPPSGTFEEWFAPEVSNPAIYLPDVKKSAGSPASRDDLASLAESFSDALEQCPLKLQPGAAVRFVASLLAKRFVILTGLAGSGKTKLAQAFARWITPPSPQCFAVVPVGADWTSNEHVLGYPDNLNGGYVQQTALKLILQAQKNPGTPHFLILDEMNLSHVERYFADLLSLIESEAELWLHHDQDADGKPKPRDGVPSTLKLPQNLFVIGTVNVDETTYMFSPKVLDRANVLEFRVSEEEMADFLESPASPNLDKLAEPGFSGAAFGPQFVQAASREYDAGLTDGERAQLKAELMTFFKLLGEHGAEFGFRVGKEMARFLHFYKKLSGASALDFRAAMDAQIVQKLLPKLHGSRNKLTGILWALAALCATDHAWKREGDQKTREEAFDKFMSDLHAAVEAGDEKFDPARIADKLRAENKAAHYPLSFDKIARMWRILEANGFVSFAEA